MKIPSTLLCALLACLFMSGCVTGRRAVMLPVTQLPATATDKGAIHVGPIQDQRVFQNKPSDPSISSINGDVSQASKAQLATMIGRQRNTWGQAIGDIALPTGESVSDRMRALLEEGFKRRGYTIAAGADAASTATATITKFWAWGTPGMWSVAFEANVACELTVVRGGVTKTIAVSGHGSNKGQVASNANWQVAYGRAFDEFLANLDAELAKAGL